jgi:hypothetical protein
VVLWGIARSGFYNFRELFYNVLEELGRVENKLNGLLLQHCSCAIFNRSERVERRVRGETEGEKEVDGASEWSRVRVVP